MSDCRQPRAGIVWRSFEFPFGGGGDECFLQSLFRQIEGAGDTDQRGDDSSVLFAKDLFELLTRLRHAGEYTHLLCGGNCRGGPPWPPVLPNTEVLAHGRPRRATPTVAPND